MRAALGLSLGFLILSWAVFVAIVVRAIRETEPDLTGLVQLFAAGTVGSLLTLALAWRLDR